MALAAGLLRLMLARRYLPQLAALLALALAPIVVHSYLGLHRDDCSDPERLVQRPGARSPAERRQEFFTRRFAPSHWVEGSAVAPDSNATLDYAVVRSYDPKTLYYRPERVLLRAEPIRVDREWAELGAERIPLHRARYKPELDRVLTAAYLLVYEGRPVDDPYRAQLLAAPRQLLTGSRPMTLFLVSERATLRGLAEAEAHTRDWLVAAWHDYQAACSS